MAIRSPSAPKPYLPLSHPTIGWRYPSLDRVSTRNMWSTWPRSVLFAMPWLTRSDRITIASEIRPRLVKFRVSLLSGSLRCSPLLEW
jgi:hypothetical protein